MQLRAMWFSCILMLALGGAAAQGALVHRYNFNGNSLDSVGGAHGLLVNNTGLATFGATQVNLGNNGTQNSNAGNGDYVDLPNGIISALGTQATFEFWTTWNGPVGSNWQRFFDFGTSNGGENISGGAPNADYLFATPRNSATGIQRTGLREGGTANEIFHDSSRGLFPIGAQQHVAVTINQGTNTASTYLNGALVGSSAIPAGLTLGSISDVNNWLGRAQWADPNYVGSYNEFRIHNSALTATQIAQSRHAGTDVFNTANQALIAGGGTTFQTVPLPVGVLNFDHPTIGVAGPTTLGGVPFDIVISGASDGWNAFGATGSNRSLTLAVNKQSVVRADLLLGTYWGEQTPGTFASVLFQASDGSMFTVELDGNFELRDYQQGGHANLINGTSTTEVVTSGNQRVDKTMIVLPDSWASKFLTSITIRDFGANGEGADNFQRLFVNGVTVATAQVPEPATASLGLLALAALVRRQRRAA